MHELRKRMQSFCSSPSKGHHQASEKGLQDLRLAYHICKVQQVSNDLLHQCPVSNQREKVGKKWLKRSAGSAGELLSRRAEATRSAATTFLLMITFTLLMKLGRRGWEN